MALTLQFLEDPEKALEHANKAIAVCKARISRLSAAPLGADAAVEDPADAVSPTGMAPGVYTAAVQWLYGPLWISCQLILSITLMYSSCNMAKTIAPLVLLSTRWLPHALPSVGTTMLVLASRGTFASEVCMVPKLCCGCRRLQRRLRTWKLCLRIWQPRWRILRLP